MSVYQASGGNWRTIHPCRSRNLLRRLQWSSNHCPACSSKRIVTEPVWPPRHGSAGSRPVHPPVRPSATGRSASRILRTHTRTLAWSSTIFWVLGGSPPNNYESCNLFYSPHPTCQGNYSVLAQNVVVGGENRFIAPMSLGCPCHSRPSSYKTARRRVHYKPSAILRCNRWPCWPCVFSRNVRREHDVRPRVCVCYDLERLRVRVSSGR